MLRNPRCSGRQVTVTTSTALLEGVLQLPGAARALVLFAHGAGSSHTSPRNAAVAQMLAEHGFGSLRFDLLTEPEAADRANVFDIALLAGRLVDATRWVLSRPDQAGLPLAYFGASTGAAAALAAAARLPELIAAVICRGGRPDLVPADLPRVKAPTLLVVGGRDEPVLSLNRLALRRLTCPKRLAIVPGATHLFEEAAALEQVAALTIEWLERYTPERKWMAEPSSVE